MSLVDRHERETQKAYVERLLRTHGSVSTYDALYNLRYLDGRKCSITRLAAIVFTLRLERFDIETRDADGELAVYRLRYAPPLHDTPRAAPAVAAPVAVAEAPAWAAAWRCSDCGSKPASEPAPMLGDLGRAFCLGCGAQRYFRRAA